MTSTGLRDDTTLGAIRLDRWAASDWNGARNTFGIPGRLRRNPHLVDDLAKAGRDDTRSGADFSLAAMLKAARISHLEAGLVLCAFPHGKANNDEWPNADARLRHVARCVLHSYEPAAAMADEKAETAELPSG